MRNEQDIVVENKRSLETKYHSFSSCFFALFLCFWGLKNICNSLFCASNDIKHNQIGVEMKENLKVFDDSVPFVCLL